LYIEWGFRIAFCQIDMRVNNLFSTNLVLFELQDALSFNVLPEIAR